MQDYRRLTKYGGGVCSMAKGLFITGTDTDAGKTVVSCGLLERYEELKISLDKLYNIKPKTADDERIIHVEYFMKKFSLCIFTGNFEEGERALTQHQKELKKFDRQFF